jgi:Tol biopolymer transport system component/DNA-binding winged helix-turn-helix (wHTH) protein
MGEKNYPIYQLGDFRFDPHEHRLSCDGKDIHLPPKSFEVLQFLVERHGHLVTKEELLEAVWPETYVAENSLSHHIWEIRSALKQNERDGHFIQTVPKVGYQFVGMVGKVDASELPVESDQRSWAKYLGVGGLLIVAVTGLLWWATPRQPETSSFTVTPLTTDLGFENWPTFSPDGNAVAFQASIGANNPGQIYVKQVGEEASLRRTSHSGLDHAASWSPDGRWIAFLRADNLLSETLKVLLIPPFAGEERELTEINAKVGWAFRPSWTPDGKALIVPDRDSSELTYSLYLISVDDGERLRLTNPATGSMGEGDRDPAMSPDGTKLAFTRDGDLHLTKLDEAFRPRGNPRTLVKAATYGDSFWGLTWTPDSEEIVFAAGVWPSARLFRASQSDEEVVKMTSLGSGTFAPVISLAGNRLAFMHWITSSDIWRIELDDGIEVIGEPTRLIGSSRLDSAPAYSPDGSRIAFRSDRSGSGALWIASLNGESIQLLQSLYHTGGTSTREDKFSWSPDQSEIAYAAVGNIRAIDVRSGKNRGLTTDSAVEEGPVWSPDGLWVYFNLFRSGRWQVCKVSADGGATVPVTSGGGRLMGVSPDGGRLYVRADGKLWSIDSEGGDRIEVLDSDPTGLVVTEQGFYYAHNPLGSWGIYFYDFDSESPSQVVEVDDFIMGLSLSPDRRHIVYGLIDHKRADLALVENFR